jgi:hypothetical protein
MGAPSAPLIEIPDDIVDAGRALYEAGYTDGLPVVPPTSARVEAMMAADPRAAEASIGRVPPRLGSATIEALAVNSVMAGARPEVFPVIVAAMEAMLEPSFNLLGVQATTHPCGPVVIVSGPIRHALKMNTRANSMGEGNEARATIGRAIRFILRNVGGAIPGTTDMVTHGNPARSGFVFAENEEDSPFSPFHTSLGFAATDSVVTVYAGEGPHNVNDHSSHSAEAVLRMIAGTVANSGSNDLGRGGKPLIVMGPEHARIAAREGYTREKIQAFMFANARFPLALLPDETKVWLKSRTDLDHSLWNERGIPVANRPEDIAIVCGGGEGRHSVYIPSFGFFKPASRKVRFEGSFETYDNKPACDC